LALQEIRELMLCPRNEVREYDGCSALALMNQHGQDLRRRKPRACIARRFRLFRTDKYELHSPCFHSPFDKSPSTLRACLRPGAWLFSPLRLALQRSDLWIDCPPRSNPASDSPR